MPSNRKHQHPAHETGALGESIKPLLSAAAVCLLALTLLYRPLHSTAVDELTPAVIFGALLLTCLFLWVCGGVLSGTLTWLDGAMGLVYVAFLAWSAISVINGHNALAGAIVCWQFATYGLTAFLVLQYARSLPIQRFLLSCLLATVATLAVYAIVHFYVYMHSLLAWLQQDPAYFQNVFDVQGGLFEDLKARIGGNRAVGNFLTSNQLACMLVMGLFPLVTIALSIVMGWRESTGENRPRVRLLAIGSVAACLLVLAALYVSGSKGGLLALVFGVAILLVGGAGGAIRRRLSRTPKPLLAGLAALLVIALALGSALLLHKVGGVKQVRASLGVRFDYWAVSARMIQQHPVLGIGPGSWKEYYTILKAPQFEETRMAHNAYLQIWSETGTVGIALFGLFWIMPVTRAWRSKDRDGAEIEVAASDPALSRLLSTGGVVLSALALAMDYLLIGTFKPPSQYVWQILQVAPWLVYLLLFAVWAVTFRAVHAGLTWSQMDSERTRKYLKLGILAGLAAFLFHSVAEVTFRVPALGASVFALAAILLAISGAQSEHRTAFTGTSAVIVLLAFLLPSIAFAVVAAPRALDHGLRRDDVLQAKIDLDKLEKANLLTRKQAVDKSREIVEALRDSTRQIPWDDETWQTLAVNAYALALQTPDVRERQSLIVESEAAARKAMEFNSLKARNWATLANLLMSTGKAKEALSCYQRAAELHPSLPESWLNYAEAAEQVEELSRRACEAYAKAALLDPLQYHPRNKLSEKQMAKVKAKLRECAQRKE